MLTDGYPPLWIEVVGKVWSLTDSFIPSPPSLARTSTDKSPHIKEREGGVIRGLLMPKSNRAEPLTQAQGERVAKSRRHSLALYLAPQDGY